MLTTAIKNKDKDTFYKLIDNYENINEVDEYGKTPLMYACNSSVRTFGLRYNGGWTGDEYARERFKQDLYDYWTSLEFIEKLLEHNARLDIQDEYGKTALFHAIDIMVDYPSDISDLHKDKINILLRHSTEYDINLMSNGWTPLMRLFYRCYYPMTSIADKMVEKGAYLTIKQADTVFYSLNKMLASTHDIMREIPRRNIMIFMLCSLNKELYIPPEVYYAMYKRLHY